MTTIVVSTGAQDLCAERFPTIISFFCGETYYYSAAQRLQEDCERLRLSHHIVEAPLPRSVSWVDACRYKVQFIAECLTAYRRPVLWMDADCRLLERPEVLASCGADLGFFLRGFRYLKDYDPVTLPRLAQPSILYFGHTHLVLEFVALMVSLEANYKDSATDDFFLQEAWQRFERPLSLLLLSPDLVCFEQPARGGQCFLFGRSGNAATFKGVAEQHEADLYTPARRKAVLMREARDSLRAGNRTDAKTFIRRAYELDPSDEALAYRVARMLRREGKIESALQLLTAISTTGGDKDHSRRFLIETAMEANDFDQAEKLAYQLVQSGSPTDAAWARSRLFRLQLEQRALRLNVPDAERPAVSWMEGPYPGNFGDLLGPYIVERLTGIPPRFVQRGRGILTSGSIIRWAKEGSIVWGAGTARLTDRLHPKAEYRAVRGPLTRKLVLESGGTCGPIYGDPSVLLPLLYRPSVVQKRYRLGLVLHHAHRGELTPADGVKAISAVRGNYEEIEKFVDELHECEAVLSTSLHGLIVSHAYGIPARWCDIPDATTTISGDGTKFRDYLLSVGLEPEAPLVLLRGTTVSADLARDANHLPRREINRDALVEIAPFHVVSAF